MAGRTTLHIPFWAWPTVLSLDAPLVAVGWQFAFAAAFGLPWRWQQGLILGLSVWLVYAADRLLDGLALRTSAGATLRHAFYALRRREVVRWWLALLAVDGAMTLAWLSPRELGAGLAVLSATGIYFLGVHRRPAAAEAIPKEAQVGLLFAVGVSFFGWGRVPAASLLPATTAFALMCACNCVLISLWEDDLDRAQGRRSVSERFPSLARRLPFALAAFVVLTLLVALVDHSLFFVMIAHGVAALATLHGLRERVPPVARRVLADAVLLLPLLALLPPLPR